MLYCILHCSWELHGCKVHCLWVDGGGGGDGGCHKPHVGTLLKRRNLAVWVFAKMFTVWFYMLYPMCRADPLCITHIVHERSLFSVHKCCWKRERGGAAITHLRRHAHSLSVTLVCLNSLLFKHTDQNKLDSQCFSFHRWEKLSSDWNLLAKACHWYWAFQKDRKVPIYWNTPRHSSACDWEVKTQMCVCQADQQMCLKTKYT